MGFLPSFSSSWAMALNMVSFPVMMLQFFWFFTCSPSIQEKEMLQNVDQVKMKQFVLSKLGNIPDQIRSVIEQTQTEDILGSPLRYRPPWEILFGNISKVNACVAGDAFHPMTPDLSQGGCSALEDAIILVKCLEDAFSQRSDSQLKDEDMHQKIKIGLATYANKRKWRAVDLISTGYVLGLIQESKRLWMRFLREKLLSTFLAGFFLSKADVDPRELVLLLIQGSLFCDLSIEFPNLYP